MDFDELKVFIHGLPPDCQENSLKDFLEAVGEFPRGVTKVYIHPKKTFAFVTVSHTDVAKALLSRTLLYCDGDGNFYMLECCPYVKQQSRRKRFPESEPKQNLCSPQSVKQKETINSKPSKCTPSVQVHPFTPDFSVLSLSKPKRKRRKKDAFAVWFSDVCSAPSSSSSKKRARTKKKKKYKVFKPEYHRSESFEFGNMYSEQKQCTSNDKEQVTSNSEVFNLESSERGQIQGNHGLNKVEEREIVLGHCENAPQPLCESPRSSLTQVIIDHDYLGPLSLQFTSPPSVADVKNEIMDRTALPIEEQTIYCNGKKLSDTLDLSSLVVAQEKHLSLLLSSGSLKGGGDHKKVESEVLGATGGVEEDPVLLTEGEDVMSMETWDAEKIERWFRSIKLDDKYGAICRDRCISGRALLLIASKSVDDLVGILDLKKGPKSILMDNLQKPLQVFDKSKPQMPRCSEATIEEWSGKELCKWLKALDIPRNSLREAKKEEINGSSLLILRKSGELRDILKLKIGSWIVLDNELSLHLERSGEVLTAAGGQTVVKDHSTSETEVLGESREPEVVNDPSIKTSRGIPLEKEKKLCLLRKALHLEIESQTDSEDQECLVRSIFVKRGKGANALEKLFTFTVILKEEFAADNPSKLWRKIKDKVHDWMKLLTKENREEFRWNDGSESFLHMPSKENVSLRDGKVVQVFLDNLSDVDFQQNVFVLLVDKQMFKSEQTVGYRFKMDKKLKYPFTLKLNANESKYHASFDPKRPSQELRYSKHFKSLLKGVGASSSGLLTLPPLGPPEAPYTQSPPQVQTLRPFGNEVSSTLFYQKGYVLNTWETGPKDLINPVHEFKLLQGGEQNDETLLDKFLYETLRFACGCLNERTNGIIHFGVADEERKQACGYEPRQVVGCQVSSKPLLNKKLTEYIDKCFVGESRSNVHNCIRPPLFIPVKKRGVSSDTYVIEVDIEPRISLCQGEIFRASFKELVRGDDKKVAYTRHGSETSAICEPEGLEEYLQKRRPALDEERKKREIETISVQNKEDQDSHKHLYDKLRSLLCANKERLDSSLYPILVLSKPGDTMRQEYLKETFGFIQSVPWRVIIDFDDEGSDRRGLCNVFKSGPGSPPCDLHEAEDYNESESLLESIECMDPRVHWIFGNGYSTLDKEKFSLKQWNNSKRKKGLNHVMQALAKTIPKGRAVVLFLLFSKECDTLADTFKDFCTYFEGPNQLVYISENSEMVKDWVAKLSSTCLEENELRERGVVGMQWTEFRECMQQLICGIDRQELHVTMATGFPFPSSNNFKNIDVVSAKECDHLNNLSYKERQQISSEVENDFYRGYSVTWRNFWFTDNHKNHVLRRENYSNLKILLENFHSRGFDGRVHTITIYHHIGAGASTMARQALWDFRRNSYFPYRCAVVTKIDDNTCKELLQLRKIGYEETKEGSESCFPPVLALIEDTEDFLFRELRSQVLDLANKLSRTKWPVCVFLYCKPTQEPRNCYSHEKETSVFLEQNLSDKEVKWFKEKYAELSNRSGDPEYDFQRYANENLISFMIMKENFNPEYVSNIVDKNLCQITRDVELTLLEYTSLLSLFNPYPVFASSFDSLMLSASLLQRNIFRDWVEDLGHATRIFLREVDVSSNLGTGKAIAIVHPIIANNLLDKIATKKGTTVSEIALSFLRSPLIKNTGNSFTRTYLHEGANRMLKQRRKYEYGDDVQTKFSGLIEKILYVDCLEDGTKKCTEESIDQAAEVLKEGLEKFNDPMLAQQLARVFYLNASAFSESSIDSCFSKAIEFCNVAIEMSPNNSYLFDTMGRIHEGKIKILFDHVLRENKMLVIKEVTPVLQLGFEAAEWFQRSISASPDHQNLSGFYGELAVMLYLLDVLRCANVFRGKQGLSKLQMYLAYCQEIPSEVEVPWEEFHERIKGLRDRFSHCMEGLLERFAIYKGSSIAEKCAPKRIAEFKNRYLSYFGKSEIIWDTQSPEDRWEHRWYQINQYLAGGIFSSVFNLAQRHKENLTKILEELKGLAYLNYGEPVKKNPYKDLLLIVVTEMALHSPYGVRGESAREPHKEYREIYDLVEKLAALEVCDEGHKRLYGHLLKVMFLWPRKGIELTNYGLEYFYDAVKILRERWESKGRQEIDPDKVHKQNIHKRMTFRKETRQYTTLFYLGQGVGLDVFVHVNAEEVSGSRGSVEWDNFLVRKRLKRLRGVVESKNIIKVQNPLDSSRTVDIYYSSREGGFSKEEVSFYLGFSWAGPVAFDVQYSKKGSQKQSVEANRFSEGQFPVYKMIEDPMTYEEYTRRLLPLRKKRDRIFSLKKKKKDGVKLDSYEEEALRSEGDVLRKLENLQMKFDSLGNFEDMYD
ncbi:PREDICTED: sterile alpha motif domain-containing protein 9-like isoform X2 [Acropora digitifera]|uniref:sterile alpha motif domain-containing protein 9-like isoform X2 n=1 Tax=Acropora digitifera TaxID=70779 RepID=UPI00077B2630|nr:PREDICTED: sterile alpha motif domain-containing protein 9-like isoform X2 [Acropora digitifera]